MLSANASKSLGTLVEWFWGYWSYFCAARFILCLINFLLTLYNRVLSATFFRYFTIDWIPLTTFKNHQQLLVTRIKWAILNKHLIQALHSNTSFNTSKHFIRTPLQAYPNYIIERHAISALKIQRIILILNLVIILLDSSSSSTINKQAKFWIC